MGSADGDEDVFNGDAVAVVMKGGVTSWLLSLLAFGAMFAMNGGALQPKWQRGQGV